VILPIALGASVLSRIVSGRHALVFSVGGAAMIIGGLAMLAGWKFSLPMVSLRTHTGGGIGSVYSLGVFSGAASACCAPVLAGVAAVSGAASSFPTALAVGVAYVFGMVAPLSALALVWDRRDWGTGRLTGRSVPIRLGPVRRNVPLGSVLSGGLLIAMGVLTVVLAARGPSMGSAWQLRLTAWLDHLSHTILSGLDWMPGAVGTLLVFGALAALVLPAIRQRRTAPAADDSPPQTVTPADAECCRPSTVDNLEERI
jgi:cytochrome c biogenesis protein CcdA